MISSLTGPIVCRVVTSESERALCMHIRRMVFVDEQHLFEGSDEDACDRRAIHIAASCDETIIGTVRIYARPNGLWWGGRLAVVKRYRGRAGRILVETAVAHARRQGARRFLARVQARNIPFFVSLRWRPVGKTFMIGGVPHRICEADLG